VPSVIFKTQQEMVRSDRFPAGFVCPDSNRFFDGVDEYFAVTDLAGFSRRSQSQQLRS
jgi:hypothetical protein